MCKKDGTGNLCEIHVQIRPQNAVYKTSYNILNFSKQMQKVYFTKITSQL